MAVFAIGDLHLSGSCAKPMHVFGEHWANHFARISADWRARVEARDVVLLPGDFSWAMTLDEARPDIEAVAALPGRKVLVRGNHDFWWSSVTQVRAALGEGMYALQNDCVELDGWVYCGTRGWSVVGEDAQDVKLCRREAMRLEMALASARRAAPDRPICALLHYPPFDEHQRESAFTDLLERYRVARVVYGHLHGPSLRNAFSGRLRGVDYFQVSCDGLDFKLLRLPE